MAHSTETMVTSPPAEPVVRSPAAQRMRNHRKRRRSGLRCFTVQVFEKEIDTLIRKGLLEPDARHNRYAVREALHKLLARTVRWGKCRWGLSSSGYVSRSGIRRGIEIAVQGIA
jgi:hypothetical protein